MSQALLEIANDSEREYAFVFPYLCYNSMEKRKLRTLLPMAKVPEAKLL
jgi:hypothetical protein